MTTTHDMQPTRLAIHHDNTLTVDQALAGSLSPLSRTDLYSRAMNNLHDFEARYAEDVQAGPSTPPRRTLPVRTVSRFASARLVDSHPPSDPSMDVPLHYQPEPYVPQPPPPPLPALVHSGSSSTSARSSAYAPEYDFGVGAAITADKVVPVPRSVSYPRLPQATPSAWSESSTQSSYDGSPGARGPYSPDDDLLPSASEDDTDADIDVEHDPEHDADDFYLDARTAAIVVAEEGRGLIVHGEGMSVSSLNIQPGTTHLLLSSLSSPSSLPSLLSSTLPQINNTLLALDISANFLGALPPALAGCTQLTELNIASNPLRVLPVWLRGLTGLRVLIADATGLNALPPELSALTSLTILSLRRNRLMSLPPWLAHLPTLERLSVEGNQFQGPWAALLAPLDYKNYGGGALNGASTNGANGSAYTVNGNNTSWVGNGNTSSMYTTSLYASNNVSAYSTAPPTPLPESPNPSTLSLSTPNATLTPSLNTNSALNASTEEEDHTIMPSRPAAPVPPSPGMLAAALPSPTLLPYMRSPSTAGAQSGFPPSSSPQNPSFQSPTLQASLSFQNMPNSPALHSPSFSATARTPSPLLRTRTTPSRPGAASERRSGSGSVLTLTERGGARSRTSSDAHVRTSSASSGVYTQAQTRPHTDYEDSGYYGSTYLRRSDGSDRDFGADGGVAHKEDEEDVDVERRREMRRMRSADELRRALESVIGPSEPRAPRELTEAETWGDAEKHGAEVEIVAPIEDVRDPPFFVARLESGTARHTLADSSSAQKSHSRPVPPPVPPPDRPGQRRFASMGPGVKPRPALGDVWDAEDEGTGSAAGTVGKTRKWGFLKKMSMGRMRGESSAPPPAPAPRMSPPRVVESPVATSATQRRSPPSMRTPLSPLPQGSVSATRLPAPLSPSPASASASLLVPPSPLPRSAKRRSFLPLDDPPALSVPSTPAFSTAPSFSTTSSTATHPTLSIPPSPALPTHPAPAPDFLSAETQADTDARVLRGVMAYLRDMADLGMASNDARPEMGRVLSDGSGSGVGLGGGMSLGERAKNTMSVATTDSGGSGGAGREEDRRGHKDDGAKRAGIVKEIVETERTYVKGLQELIDIYVKPASQPVNTLGNAVASTKETVVPVAERKIVFNGLDSLLSFHKQSFLPALEKAARAGAGAPDPDEGSLAAALAMANVFVSHAAFMRMYSTYINNFDNAVHRLKQWTTERRPTTASTPGSSITSPSSSTSHLAGMALQISVVPVAGHGDSSVASGVQPLSTSQRKRIKTYLKRCRLNPQHSQLNLEGYLLLPVQRIPRYRLLLEELVRCTPPKIDAYDDPLDHALTEISSLANNMNEGKRDAESRRKLVQWQTRIRGKFPSPLVQPHRRLIMDGGLHLTRVVRKSSMAFDVINSSGDSTNVTVECLAPEETPRSLVGILCNDLLVLCKDQSAGKDHTGSVDLWAVLRMQTLPQPASIVHGNALRVVDNKAILYFDAPSTSEALTWCRAINMHIPASKI